MSLIKFTLIVSSPIWIIALYIFYHKSIKSTFSNKKTETPTDTTSIHAAVTSSEGDFSKKIVNKYLMLKNALVNDDGVNAASAGQELSTLFKNIDTATQNAVQKTAIKNIAFTASSQGEYIGSNSENIDLQRKYFDTLSNVINDFVKLYGVHQKLYQNFCPMYNDGKGATWISETEEIRNPFYGSQMLSCGKVVESIKQ